MIIVCLLPCSYNCNLQGQDVYIAVLKGMICLFQMWVDSRALTWGVGPPVLCHSFMERLFCLPSVQICAVLAALNSINYITLLMPQRVSRFEVNRDTMFIKDPPEILRRSCDIGIDDAFKFFRLLHSVCPGFFRGFDKGPVWVATGFKFSTDVVLFLLLPLCLCGYGLSPVDYSSNDPQLVLQRAMNK